MALGDPAIKPPTKAQPEWQAIPGRPGWFESTAKNPDGSRRKTYSPYGTAPEPSVKPPPPAPTSHQPYIPPEVYVSPDDPYADGFL